MSLFNHVRPLLASIGLASAIIAQPAAAHARPQRPAMWKVADADTTVYLFGTVHLLPRHLKWQTPAFRAAAARSDELVVETILDDNHPGRFAELVSAAGIRDGLPPVLERVSPDKRAALTKAIAASGIAASVFDRMETWLVGFTLVTTQFRSIGLQGADGVEAILKRHFSAAGKPIGELETNADQIAVFDRLPEAAQRKFVEASLSDDGDLKQELAAMIDSWKNGDTKRIAATFNAEMSGSPDLADALLRRRNTNWTQWVRQRLARPGTVMVAVGAGHLAGDGSVIDQLVKAGVKVERVQ